MTQDMRDKFSETKIALEKLLRENTLTHEQLEIVSTAMKFGYSAAFCSRTSDMNGSFLLAQEYDRVYNQIIEKLK